MNTVENIQDRYLRKLAVDVITLSPEKLQESWKNRLNVAMGVRLLTYILLSIVGAIALTYDLSETKMLMLLTLCILPSIYMYSTYAYSYLDYIHKIQPNTPEQKELECYQKGSSLVSEWMSIRNSNEYSLFDLRIARNLFKFQINKEYR